MAFHSNETPTHPTAVHLHKAQEHDVEPQYTAPTGQTVSQDDHKLDAINCETIAPRICGNSANQKVHLAGRQTSSGSASAPLFVHLSCESMVDGWHGNVDDDAVDHRDRHHRGICCGENMCTPREGLEAWLLLIRVIVYNALTGINFSCFGLLYIEYTDYFQASKADVGWVVSIQASVISLLGTSSFARQLIQAQDFKIGNRAMLSSEI